MKKTYKISRLFSSLLAIGLVGCTSINSTSFNNMTSAYREVVEEYTNNNILLNIVRSSKNMPMSFLDIPSVIGTGNVLTNAGATTSQSAGSAVTPPSIFGGSLGLTVNNGFTFTQSSLDNSQFLGSFLKEIPLNVLGFKGTERNLPKAVSYSILIESIELRSKNVLIYRFNNDPLDSRYAEFQEALYLLIEAGLTVENASIKTPLGPPLASANLNQSLNSWGTSVVDEMAKGNFSLDKTTINGKELYQLSRNDRRMKVCVNKYRAQELLGDILSQAAFCQDSPKLSKSILKVSSLIQKLIEPYRNGENVELVIGIRSPGNAFDFLGSVLNAQYSGDASRLVMIRAANSNHESIGDAPERPLFKIYKNMSINSPVATVSYKGVTYAVSDDDGSYTKQVLEFMSTMVTMAKIPGAIPASPAVIVR